MLPIIRPKRDKFVTLACVLKPKSPASGEAEKLTLRLLRNLRDLPGKKQKDHLKSESLQKIKPFGLLQAPLTFFWMAFSYACSTKLMFR